MRDDEKEMEGIEEEVIEILSEDADAEKKLLKPDIKKIATEEKFYFHILKYLTGFEFEENEARDLWYKILRHKYLISEKLGRNVGFRVAALDYFMNIKGILKAVTFVDIGAFNRLKTDALHDSLTRVFRRNVLEEKGREFLKIAKEEGKKLSFIFFDIDFFKKFNDTMGHLAGDAVLYEVARTLRNYSKNVFRYGGDEFVVVEFWDFEKAKEVAQEVENKIKEKSFSAEKFKKGVSISFGISVFPDDGEEFKELLKTADDRLYEEKRKKHKYE
ncbi:MAG: GGDEF domain-containing protein [Elusimicrobia bacterium]|nr:GGDEF domain-containing protein [Elusimicrobiota bacterium]